MNKDERQEIVKKTVEHYLAEKAKRKGHLPTWQVILLFAVAFVLFFLLP